MGWGRMFLLGDWGQQMDIEDQKAELRSLRARMQRQERSRSADLKQRIARVERENGELRLHLAALIRYLGNTGALDRDAFGALVDAIDAEDGTVDGAFSGSPID